MADEKSSVESEHVSVEPEEPVEEPEKKPAEEPHKEPEEPEETEKKPEEEPKKPAEEPKKTKEKPAKEPAKTQEKKAMDPRVLRSFLRHLMLISKKKKIKIKAQQELSKHISKLKEAKKLDPKRLKRSLERLDKKISDVIEAERKLAAVGREDPEIVKMLKDEIIQLKDRLKTVEMERNKYATEHKEKMEDLGAELTRARTKLSAYAKKKIEREERIKELMEKIKATPVKEHEIIAAKKQLESLERKFRQLSRTAYGKERLSKLKERIDELKQKLAVV
ncbi:hypothetical protein KY361_05920 [Candidatus Woesearchaeota archaeon]|nr:hypothetical protein [Candidatus Woesearchaeota archaeon]